MNTVPISPLPGPLDLAPDVHRDAALTMLDIVLDEIEMGPWDVEVRTWVELADPAYMATLASWCRRSWQAGVEVGRAECAEEIDEYHRRVQAARAELDALRARRP